MSQSSSTHYRPDIDGLRAVAVFSVILFHFSANLLSGGFVGVDVFFVISGYLITGILKKQIETGGIQYLDFYARRIRRIFPSLILLLIASLIFGWCFYLPLNFQDLSHQVVAGGLFFYNFLLIKDVGYFDALASHKALLHLWSLGIEEQFYFIWPMILSLAFRWRRFGLLGILIFAVISFSANLWLLSAHPALVYYLPLTRFWELMIGASLLIIEKKAKLATSSSNGFSLAGLALIIYSAIFFRSDLSFPGWRALIPTIGASLVILAGAQAWINRKILATRPMVFLGLISYPLYLWHWPALNWSNFLFQKMNLGFETSILNFENQLAVYKVVFMLLAIIMAYLSYRFVETWVRSSRSSRTVTLTLLAFGIFVLPAVATMTSNIKSKNGEVSGLSSFLEKYNMESDTSDYRKKVMRAYRLDCSFTGLHDEVRERIDDSCAPWSPRPQVMLWGDSHVQHLRPGIDHFLKSKSLSASVIQVTSGSCWPSLGLQTSQTRQALACNNANAFALETISRQRPLILILSQALGYESNSWLSVAQKAKELGVKYVFAIGPVPRWTGGLPQIVAENYWPRIPIRMKSHLQSLYFDIDRELKDKFSNSALIHYISAMDAFCESRSCQVSTPENESQLMSHDSGHLTPEGSVWFVEWTIGPIIAPRLLVGH